MPSFSEQQQRLERDIANALGVPQEVLSSARTGQQPVDREELLSRELLNRLSANLFDDFARSAIPISRTDIREEIKKFEDEEKKPKSEIKRKNRYQILRDNNSLPTKE